MQPWGWQLLSTSPATLHPVLPDARKPERGVSAVSRHDLRGWGTPRALVPCRFLVATGFKQDESDVFLSYLPLAHIFDRVAEEFYLSIGATIGYFSGDTRKLTDDLAALKPTLFVGVPRVFERVQTGVYAKASSLPAAPGLLGRCVCCHSKGSVQFQQFPERPGRSGN